MNLYLLYRHSDKELIPDSVPGELNLKTKQYQSSELDSEKIDFILDKIDEEWGSSFCITDPGINIYQDFSLEIQFQAQDKDIAAINTPNGFTLSLLYIKANPQTRSFFTAIKKSMQKDSPLFTAYKSGGVVCIFNIFSKNYCRIKHLDNRFFNIPTIVFDKVFNNDILKIKLYEITKSFYSCHFDFNSEVSDIKSCQQTFLNFRNTLSKNSSSINKFQLQNLKTVSTETSNIVSHLQKAIDNLKIHSDIMKIKLDGFLMDEDIKTISPEIKKQEAISIAYNRPINFNDTRFKISEDSRIQLEEKSRHKVSFINCLPSRNSSTIKPNTDKPFLKDLINKAAESEAEWIGYVNADVSFSEEFLLKLNFISSEGYNAISGMTYSISPNVSSLIESQKSEPLIPLRGGRDLFLFKKELWPVIESTLPDYLIGEPEWDVGLFYVLNKLKQVKLFDHCTGDFIYQLYHEQKWNTETKLSRYNTNQSKKFKIPIHETFTSLKNRSMIS